MQVRHKSSARHRCSTFLSVLLLFTALFLFLLVSLSLPIIKPIYLFSVQSTTGNIANLSLAQELRVGVWGACAVGALVQPSLFNNHALCLCPALHVTIPPRIADLVGVPSAVLSAMSIVLFVVLVLHPIVASLSFVNFITAWFVTSHVFAIFGFVASIVNALAGMVTLAIDLAIVLVVRAHLKKSNNFDFKLVIGNGDLDDGNGAGLCSARRHHHLVKGVSLL